MVGRRVWLMVVCQPKPMEVVNCLPYVSCTQYQTEYLFDSGFVDAHLQARVRANKLTASSGSHLWRWRPVEITKVRASNLKPLTPNRSRRKTATRWIVINGKSGRR